MELPAEVRDDLEDLGDGASIRYLGAGPAGPRWACGWMQDVPPAVRTAAYNHLSSSDPVDDKTRNLLLNIIEGWRPAFGVTGRLPDKRDVNKLKLLSYRWREERLKVRAEMFALTEKKDKTESIASAFREIVDDHTLYRWACWGRKSIVSPGLNQESQPCQNST